MAYKEIVTKAVVGKGKKFFKNNYTLTPEVTPTTILGAWIINHKFKGYKKDDNSYDNNSKTAVVNKKIEYNDLFNLKIKDDSDNTDIIVRTLNQPNCVSVNIDKDNNINFDVEKELGVEIVGEKKMKIAVEDDEEPWDILEDEVEEDDLKQIDKEVNTEYIKEKDLEK